MEGSCRRQIAPRITDEGRIAMCALVHNKSKRGASSMVVSKRAAPEFSFANSIARIAGIFVSPQVVTFTPSAPGEITCTTAHSQAYIYWKGVYSCSLSQSNLSPSD